MRGERRLQAKTKHPWARASTPGLPAAVRQLSAWLLAVCCLVLILLTDAPAAEIDSITSRGVALDDSLSRLNQIINQRLQSGIAAANGRPADWGDRAADEYCDPEELYRELRKAIFQSFTASWGLKGYELDLQLRELLAASSYRLPLNDSIYRDIDYLEGFSLNLKELSHVVRLDGHLVGLDKLGHFFAEGWRYFDLAASADKGLASAMAWGRAQEEGKYGYTTTGIFSYADLVANFHGFRFWNRVLKPMRDPLHSFWRQLLSSPYVTCDVQLIASIRHRKVVRAWELNAAFDLADYLDGGWDEGNNCNSYADPEVERKVTARIEAAAPGFHCPDSPDQCREIRSRYGTYARELLHPSCLNAP